MRNRVRAIGATLLLFGLLAVAQDRPPKVDTFFGYSFLRVNSDQNIPAFTMNGGLFNAGFNLTNHFAIEAEFGGYHNGNVRCQPYDQQYRGKLDPDSESTAAGRAGTELERSL